jgi:PAS domain S-box-containing protein
MQKRGGESAKITERKKAEQAANEAREYAEAIVNAVREPLLVLDEHLRVFSANKSFYQFFKSDENETIGKLIFNLGNGQWNIPKLKRLLNDILPQKIQIRGFEVTHNFESIGLKTMLLDGRMINLEGSKAKGILLVIEDITERKVAKGLLSASEARYHRLFESAKDGILILDAKTGTIIDVNPFLIKLLGFSHKQFLAKKIWDIGVLKDIAASKAQFLRLQKKGYIKYENLPLRTAKGEQINAEFISNVYNVDNQKVVYCNIRDITKRKRAEEDLCKAEERFRIASETSNDVVYEWDLRHSVQWFGKIDEMLGYGPGEFPRTLDAWADLIHPEDRKRVMAALQAHLDGRVPYVIEYRVQRKDGTYRWWAARGAATRTPDGHPVRWIGTVTDITERKKSEKALKESEERFRVIFDNANDGILLADAATKKFYIGNNTICQMLGYSLEEIKNLGVPDIHPKKDLPYVLEQFKRQTRKEIALAKYLPVKRKDGSVFYADVNTSLVTLAGRTYLLGIFRDITSRRRSEEELKNSEERFRNLFENAVDPIVIIDRKGNFVQINKRTEELFGYDRKQYEGRNFLSMGLFPAKTKIVVMKNFLKRMAGGEIKPYEVEIYKKNGELVVGELNAAPITESGKTTGEMIIVRDMTWRKSAEDDLKKSEEKYRFLVDNIEEFVLIISKTGKMIFVNNKALKSLDYSAEEIIGKSILSFLTKNSVRKAMYALAQEFLGRPQPEMDIEIKTKTGEIRTLRVAPSSIPVYDKGKMIGIQVNCADVTERKKMNEAIKTSEEQFKRVFEYAPDAYYLNDLKGNFINGNKAAEELTGYKKEELIGKSFLKLKLLSPKSVPKAAELLVKNSLGKPTGPDRFVLIRKNGSHVTAEIMTYPVKFKDKTLVLGIARDITEREKNEEELIKSKEELEEKLKQLETFNKVSVGRELKMIELKNRIKELERRKGKE